MIVERLSLRGHEVVAFDNAIGVVDRTRSAAPDVVILDMSLPEVDGWEAVGLLKAAADTREIPVLALTAHAMSCDRDKALAAGCDDYETKPVDFARLDEKIARLVGGR